MSNTQGVKKWFLFLIAFVVSCMIWYMVVADSDSKISVSLGDVEVTLIGLDDLHEKGYAVYVTDSTKVAVTVTVPQEKGWLVNSSNLRLRADLGEITSFQTESILYLKPEILSNASVIGNNYKLEKNYITVRTEKLVEEEIPISTETTGTPANGYVAAEGTAEEDSVKVRLPESLAGTGIYAEAFTDVTDMQADYKGAAKLIFYDADGNALNLEALQILSEKSVVNVEIPIGNLTKISVGLPDPDRITLDGRKCIAITSEQSDFSVVCSPGKQTEGISVSIPVSAFKDLEINSSADETANLVSLRLSDYLPEGYNLYRKIDDDLGVEVVSKLLKRKTIYFSASAIEMSSLEEGYTATVKDASCAIVIEATGDYLDLLTNDMITLTLDLKGLKAGSATLTPEILLNVEGTDLSEYTIVSISKLVVNLTKIIETQADIDENQI